MECYQIRENDKKLLYKDKLEGKARGLLEYCRQKGINKKGCFQKENQIVIKLKQRHPNVRWSVFWPVFSFYTPRLKTPEKYRLCQSKEKEL